MAGNGVSDRGRWVTALEELTEAQGGQLVSIEVLDMAIGHQYEAERLPFSYLTYDPKDDVVIVAVGGDSPRYPVVLRHMVRHPREIDVSTVGVPEPAVRVVDQDGAATLITFFPGAAGTES
ncbi:DUF5335 family protein [Streptomyces vietnamensis]|uniref:DUF5335 family protein n=1 Tax=Streptomyces vietnamensis TaxID=362257 RepID=UPI00342A3A99